MLWFIHDAATIQSSALHVEKAILLGRVGEHRKALRLLVDEDEKAAENYCWRTSAGRGREFTQELFSWLLQAHLESRPHVSAAVDLLNQNAVAFNLLRVLELLPGSWSVQLVMRFLCESLRLTAHDRRMKGLEKNLARMDNLRQRHTWVRRSWVEEIRQTVELFQDMYTFSLIRNESMFKVVWCQEQNSADTEACFHKILNKRLTVLITVFCIYIYSMHIRARCSRNDFQRCCYRKE